MMMTDLTSAIEPKSDQLNSDDLVLGPRTIKITKVIVKESGEQRVWVYFDGDHGKPWKPAKTMTRLLGALWKTDRSSDFVGKSVRLYRDDAVTWGALAVGGIRVSHVSHITEKTIVMVRQKKGVSLPVTIYPLKEEDEAPRQETKPADAPKPADPYAPYSREFKHLLDTKPWQDVNDWWVETEARREGMAADRVANMSAALADKMNAALAAKIEKENG